MKKKAGEKCSFSNSLGAFKKSLTQIQKVGELREDKKKTRQFTEKEKKEIISHYNNLHQKRDMEFSADVFLKDLSLAPNTFLQTMLFRPISSESQRKVKRNYEEICGFSNEKYSIMVFQKGEDFDQNDLDLFLWLVSKADPDTFSVSFSRSQALGGCDRARTKENYVWLENSLDRLMTTNIKFFQRELHGKGKRIYRGGLIRYATEEVKGKTDISGKNKLEVFLSVLPSLLLYDTYTHLDKKVKFLLKRQQLARFLYGWFKGNSGTKGFHLKEDLVISNLQNPSEENNNFIKRLKVSGLDPLVKLGILKDYEIKKDTIFLVWDKNFDNAKNNSIEVKKTIRKEYSKERKIQKVKPKKNVRQVTEELISKPDDDEDGGTWPRTGWATDW